MDPEELEELFGNVEMSDVSNIPNILRLTEVMQEEDNEFMELLKEKLGSSIITWHRPWYQEIDCLTRKVKEVDTEDELFDTGGIIEVECEHIMKRWHKLLRKHDLPDKLSSFARWRNKASSRRNSEEEKVRRYITAYLAKGLKRNLHQVYRHVYNIYGFPVRGPYSKLEEKIMYACFYHFPNKAVLYLSLILGREPRAIYTRLQESILGKRERKQKIKWTLPVASKFLNKIMEYTGKSLDELKDYHIETSVWQQLEEDMNQYSIYLQRFWYSFLSVQLFVRCNIKLRRLRRKILKKIRDLPYTRWADIRWKDLVQYFPDGLCAVIIYHKAQILVRDYPNYRTAPLNKVIKHGLRKINTFPGRHLRTLTLNKDGELERITY